MNGMHLYPLRGRWTHSGHIVSLLSIYLAVTSRQIFRWRVYAVTSPFPSYTSHVPAKPKTLSRQNPRSFSVYKHHETVISTSHCQILHQRGRKHVLNAFVSRNRIRLEKSVLPHVAKKCPLLCGFWMFNVGFTAARYCMIGWCKYTHSTSSLPVY
jgi:hypothetical protein